VSEIERSLTYIRDHARIFAKAKSQRVYLEQFRKSKKAMLMAEAAEETKGSGRNKKLAYRTGQERESYAYSNSEYLQILDGLKEAVEIEEKEKFMIIAAQLKVEVWRTQQANNRQESKNYGN